VAGVPVEPCKGQPDSSSLRDSGFGSFVVLKHSKIGTVGYRVGDVKIVGLDGRPATLFSLTVRLAFEPAGSGRAGYRPYEICGYNFLFREVEVPSRFRRMR
jgi:hypothetical protein